MGKFPFLRSDKRGYFDPVDDAQYQAGGVYYEAEAAHVHHTDGSSLDFQQSGSGSYSPQENAITLTPNADISTFSHEMGHWWLANAIELSKSNQTDLSLRKDVRTLLDVFGVKDQTEWGALGIEGQRRYHEAFASWVEEYLTTGRVPDGRVQRSSAASCSAERAAVA